MNTTRLFRMTALAACIGTASFLGACGGGGGGDGAPTPTTDPQGGMVDIQDANAMMAALTGKIATGNAQWTIQSGTPPAEAGIAVLPKLFTTPTVEVVPNSTVDLAAVVAGGEMDALFAKIPGANSFFQLQLNTGKSLNVQAKNETGFSFNLLVLNARLSIPGNLDGDGEFCLGISGKLDNNVSAPEATCVNVVGTRTVPPDNQPNAEGFAAALAGEWQSPCFDLSKDADGNGSLSVSEQRSAKQWIHVDATNYSVYYDDYPGSRTCSGEATRYISVGGTFAEAGATTYTANGWARPVDFKPDGVLEGAITSHNLVQLVPGTGQQADVLYLGYPVPYIQSSDTDDIGRGKTAANRPTNVLTGLPFTRG